jgi:hypothetical protein
MRISMIESVTDVSGHGLGSLVVLPLRSSGQAGQDHEYEVDQSSHLLGAWRH